jgi:hypothetical protein
MIDGVKIHIANIDVKQMLNNPVLSFIGSYDANTGEILTREPLTAKYNGLTLRLVPSTINKNPHCLIDGSIHRFYNQGGTNRSDFNFTQLHECLNSFERLIKQPLNSLALQNLEFGVNIKTELTAAKIINSIIINGNRRFAELDVKNLKIGKVCTKPGADYELKIYDKGKQARTGEKNILRIEVKVKKMRFLEPYGIKTLNSLLSLEKIGVLGQILADMWANLIFYDGSINEKNLTDRELLKLKDYQNPLFWERLTYRERYKAKEDFNAILLKYSDQNTQQEIEKLILNKWKSLVNWKRKNRGCFHQLTNELEADKKGMFSPLEYTVKTSPQGIQKNQSENSENFNQKTGTCQMCGGGFLLNKLNTKFCSTRCRNKANNMKRQTRRNERQINELMLLEEITPQLKNNSFPVVIEKNTQGGTKRKRTSSGKIKPMDYSELRQILSIEITITRKKYIFTTVRAKELIKRIIEFNNLNNS